MKCFFPFKSKSKQMESKSAPELRNRSNSLTSALDQRGTKSSSAFPSPRSIPELYNEKEQNLIAFSFQELRDSTNGFSRLQKVGEGGFGSVYKGTIQPKNGNGSPILVAIKKLNPHSLQVIYRDFKSSNVLLDENFNAKLSDFGLAREGPQGDRTHVSTAVVGTYGYAAPEYVETGHLSIHSDL